MRIAIRGAAGALALGLLLPTAAYASEDPPSGSTAPATDASGLSAAQLATIAALENAQPVSASAASRLPSRFATTHATSQ